MSVGIDAVLDDVFRWGHIEALLTSIDLSGKPNTAPMGVDRKGLREVELRIYRDTKTFRNVALGNRWLVLTLSSDSMDYYASLMGELEYETIPGWPIPSPVTRCRYPVLLARVSSVGNDEPATVIAEVMDHSFIPNLRSCKQSYSRANAGLIEALIYLTKIRALSRKQNVEVLCRLLDKLVENASLALRLGAKELRDAADNVISLASNELRKAGIRCRD